MSDARPSELVVRIGELRRLEPGDDGALVAVGLGSCVGVVLVDRVDGAAALAHVFLPARPSDGVPDGAGPGTYADDAIPRLVDGVRGAWPRGERASGLMAVVAGGASMFGARPGGDVGQRNLAAVDVALQAAGIPVVARDVGGRSGRTLRVDGGDELVVTVRAVGSDATELWRGRPTRGRARDAAA